MPWCAFLIARISAPRFWLVVEPTPKQRQRLDTLIVRAVVLGLVLHADPAGVPDPLEYPHALLDWDHALAVEACIMCSNRQHVFEVQVKQHIAQLVERRRGVVALGPEPAGIHARAEHAVAPCANQRAQIARILLGMVLKAEFEPVLLQRADHESVLVL